MELENLCLSTNRRDFQIVLLVHWHYILFKFSCEYLTVQLKLNVLIFIGLFMFSVTEHIRYALSENGIVYCAMTYCFGEISVWSRIILLNFCWVSIFFDIFIANISWTVAQTPINHSIFWKKCNENFQTHICKLL